MGQNCFVQLDDDISDQPDRVSAAAASLIHQKDLKSCGFKINAPKHPVEQMQVGEWLGFVIDTIRMEFVYLMITKS